MKKKHTIFLKTGRGELTKIRIENIIYLKADGNYTHIKCCNPERKFIICKNLKNTIALVDSDQLMRIHRSMVVNLNYIKVLKTGKTPLVILKNDEKIKISRKVQDKIKQNFIHTE